MMKQFQDYIYFIQSLFIVFLLSSCQIDQDDRPNIVLLLADDLGYGELGSYGQTVIKTPNLDELAEKSMIFTNFYAGSPVCSPSRAVLLTGKSSSHVSIRGNAAFVKDSLWEQIALDKNEYTLGEMFNEAGYQSAFVGKWHLDTADEPEHGLFHMVLILLLKNNGEDPRINSKKPGYGLMVTINIYYMILINTIVKMLFTLIQHSNF